jgi:CMP-2-keto-3-deoxyoctulosonic acid synthetase
MSLNSSYLEDTESIEQLRVLEAGIKIISQKLDEDGFSIDTPIDLLKIRKIFLDGNH